MTQAKTNGAVAPIADARDEAVASDQLLHDVMILTPQLPTRADGIAVGTLDGFDINGGALVSIPTLGLSRIPARSINPLDGTQVGQSLALGFEDCDPLRPIILGFMLTAPQAGAPVPAEVLLDGERIALTAERQIELRCGDAALILSADGRIELRGTYITSYASATQRILGGSVNIN
ncbi:hypothetical protein IV454_10450 [Massilia antarctica]|uniref:DUF6484 domain-containing protein n=1 Tax=Massilia antarctica TaxID=2765360 RepID=A0AA49A9Q1_9BURK|nr:DUF6484 domain-containing protein [Massilia antarctica]QPI51873.1 hypothetical protein IV454_10450 [Massilia antarctica]